MVYQCGRQRNISSFMRSFRKQGQKVGKALQNSCSTIRFAKIDACSNCRFFFPSRPFVMNACRWIGCSHFGLQAVWHKKQAALVLAKFAHVLCTRRTSSALLFYPNLSGFQTVLDPSACLHLVKPQLHGCRVSVMWLVSNSQNVFLLTDGGNMFFRNIVRTVT